MRRRIFGDTHGLFRASVRQFVERAIEPRSEEYRSEGRIPRDVWVEAGRQGFLGLGVESGYGGSDVQDFRFNAVLGEELARQGLAYASAFTVHTDVVIPYLTLLGTPEQKQRWLPRACSGEYVTALAMTEPGAGSDLAAIRTSAERRGDCWTLNGSKTFVTNGDTADLVLLAARTSQQGQGGRGITLFAVESESEGFSRGSRLDKIGQPEASTCELFLSDVQVNQGNVVGEVDRGFIHMMEQLPQERLSSAITNLAHAEAALSETIQYIKGRRAFGQPIGSFQHNKFLVARLVTSLDVTRAFVDDCLLAHVEGQLSPTDAAKAKWWSSEVQNEILDACVQLYGGYGYMREYMVARAWADGRVTRIWAGTNEIMQELIGRSLGL
jgi:alkylation response protein AidB-like acyl-CoA dehydrogenase